VTAAVARVATPDDHPLLDGYAAWCHTLGVSDRVLRDRLWQARQFLAAHPDLDAWMRRPVAARLADLGRIRAWSLVTYLILTGGVDPSPYTIDRAADEEISVLLTRLDTRATVSRLENIFLSSRFESEQKLERMRALLDEHLDWGALRQALGLPVSTTA